MAGISHSDIAKKAAERYARLDWVTPENADQHIEAVYQIILAAINEAQDDKGLAEWLCSCRYGLVEQINDGDGTAYVTQESSQRGRAIKLLAAAIAAYRQRGEADGKN